MNPVLHAVLEHAMTNDTNVRPDATAVLMISPFQRLGRVRRLTERWPPEAGYPNTDSAESPSSLKATRTAW